MEPGLGLFAFNRGVVSRLALARYDVKRMAMSAAQQTNWLPRVMGSMSIRTGLGYIGDTLGDGFSKFLPFIKQTTDIALCEFTSTGVMQVWVNDQVVSLPPVGTTVANVNVDISGWTNHDEAGGASSFAGGLYQVSNGFAFAIVDQTVTVAPADQGKEHGIFIVVAQGPVQCRIGTNTSDDSYIRETLLDAGDHWLSFTPTGNFNIRLMNLQQYNTLVSNVVIRSGPVQVRTNYTQSDLANVRWDQSADVIYLACTGKKQQKIERRTPHSWSCVEYFCPDGPFRVENITPTTIAASATTGNVVLTASRSIFYAPGSVGFTPNGHLGSLWQIVSQGQNVSLVVTGENQWTPAVKVTGTDAARDFALAVTNSDGNLTKWTLQFSVGVPGVWQDATSVGVIYPTSPRTLYTTTAFEQRTANWPEGAVPGAFLNDQFNNSVIYYRVGVKTGDFLGTSVNVSINYAGGEITGTVRITAVNSPVSANGKVLQVLGNTTAVSTWSEGEWSDVRGWPTSVNLYEGRLWWAGKNGIWGSVSDGYQSFDPTIIGDSGPINRTIGSGPVDIINFMIPLMRLITGAQGSEWSIRTDALDGVLTPTNFNIKNISGLGSAAVPGIKIDQNGLYVGRTGFRAYQLAFDFKFYDYSSTDITVLCPDVLKPGVVRIAVQRMPETRVHFVLSNGTAVIQVQSAAEEVSAFIPITTNGIIEDVVVLPAISGNEDDQVYYVVNRTINGATKRYLEKFAQQSQCLGNLPLCLVADSYIAQTFGSPQTVITGLSTLEGQNVVVWADGFDVGTAISNGVRTLTYTVTGGQITLAVAATNVVVGLPYTAIFLSTKLGAATAQIQSPLNRKKKIQQIGLVMADVYKQAIQYGTDVNNLYDMSEIERGTIVSDGVAAAYDEPLFNFGGTYTTDARVCLVAQAPRPATVMAIAIDLVQNI